MDLFGVSHWHKHLDRHINEIEAISGGTRGKIMMLELAPNYAENVAKGILQPSFFMALRDHFRSKCSRIICGDQALTIPKKPDWIAALVLGEDYFYPSNKRDEIMVATVKTEKPDIVVVGSGHSDNLKKHYPFSYYTVFEPKGGYTNRYGQRIPWNSPNRIISL